VVVVLSRRRSYGLLTTGMSGVGLPILSTGGSPVAGTSIASNSERIPPACLAEFFRFLQGEIIRMQFSAAPEHPVGRGRPRVTWLRERQAGHDPANRPARATANQPRQFLRRPGRQQDYGASYLIMIPTIIRLSLP
jgi:hypothetical protein